MTPEKIIEIAHRYSDKAYPHPDDPASLKMAYWEFREKDLIAFAHSVIAADRESSDEPVAWQGWDKCGMMKFRFKAFDGAIPLYRHPPPAQKLTDEEISEIMIANGFKIKDGCDGLKPYVFQAVRAIERRINGEDE